MGGSRCYVIGPADRELAAVGGGPGFDRQRALEHEIPIGHGAVKVPGDHLARRQGENACLHVAADRHRLDRFDRVSLSLRHRMRPSTVTKQLVAVTLQPRSRRRSVGVKLSTRRQKRGPWFITARCATSCATTYSSTGSGAKIKRQLKERFPCPEQLPHRLLVSRTLTRATLRPMRAASRCARGEISACATATR